MLEDFAKTYLIRIKNYSVILFVFLIISIFLGYDIARDYPEKIKQIVYETLKNIFEPAKEYSSFKLFTFILFRNLIVALVNVLLGIIFGIVPVLIVIINGLTLGIISYIILEQYDIFVLMAGILPHGIIEIPALILSAASGLWLWRSVWQRLLYDKGEFKNEFISIIKFFILIIAPLLFIAAMIETFITPRILNSVIMINL